LRGQCRAGPVALKERWGVTGFPFQPVRRMPWVTSKRAQSTRLGAVGPKGLGFEGEAVLLAPLPLAGEGLG